MLVLKCFIDTYLLLAYLVKIAILDYSNGSELFLGTWMIETYDFEALRHRCVGEPRGEGHSKVVKGARLPQIRF